MIDNYKQFLIELLNKELEIEKKDLKRHRSFLNLVSGKDKGRYDIIYVEASLKKLNLIDDLLHKIKTGTIK